MQVISSHFENWGGCKPYPYISQHACGDDLLASFTQIGTILRTALNARLGYVLEVSPADSLIFL
jgi:hypothetical protein